MKIVDAQVHIWQTPPPPSWRATPHRQLDAFTDDMLLAEMDEAGIAAALLVPTGWEDDGFALKAAHLHPSRFGILRRIALDHPRALSGWSAEPGVLGLRLAFNTPASRTILQSGDAEWLWQAAERASIPIGSLLVPGLVGAVADVAARYPGLRLTVSHLGTPRADLGIKDAAAFEHLPELLTLARFPNVAVACTGLPGYSSEPYPYPSLAQIIRKVFDAFGPRRMFWGTDLTRMTLPYSRCVSHFSQELPWLCGNDRALVMGQALCDWLAWRLV